MRLLLVFSLFAALVLGSASQDIVVVRKPGAALTPLALRWNGTATNNLQRVTGTLDYNAAYTCMGWARIVTDTNAIATILIIGTDDSNADLDIVQVGSDGVSLFVGVCNNGTCGNSSTTALAVGTWYHWAAVRSSTTLITLYIDGNSAGTSTTSVVGRSSSNEMDVGRTKCCGGFSGEPWNGRIAAMKCWASAFNEAQVEAEMNNYNAQAASPWGVWNMMVADGLDSSGNARHFTVNGTITVEAGPSISQ